MGYKMNENLNKLSTWQLWIVWIECLKYSFCYNKPIIHTYAHLSTESVDKVEYIVDYLLFAINIKIKVNF